MALYPVPAAVRAEAREGLRLRRLYGRGGTGVGLATARRLASGRPISLAKAMHVSRYFPRHAGDRLEQSDPPSNGYIAWRLWGGDAGREWSERIAREARRR